MSLGSGLKWRYPIVGRVDTGIYELADGHHLVRVKYRGRRSQVVALASTIDEAREKRLALIAKYRSAPPPPDGGFVYFAEAVGTDRIKIGWSRHHPSKRLVELQTGCPFPIRLLSFFPGFPEDERRLHVALATSRVSPSIEWFYATAEVLEAARGGETR